MHTKIIDIYLELLIDCFANNNKCLLPFYLLILYYLHQISAQN